MFFFSLLVLRSDMTQRTMSSDVKERVDSGCGVARSMGRRAEPEVNLVPTCADI